MESLARAALLLCLALPAAAQDATLIAVTGRVYIRAEGEKRAIPAKKGDTLIYGDSVKTGPKSVAHILFSDAAAVLVQENSRLTLQGSPDHTTVKFSIGEFLVGVKKHLTAGQSFRVKTPAAVAAVRGTLFWGKVEKDGTTTFAGLGRTISVRSKGKTVIVKSGQKTSVVFGEAPKDPQPHDIPAEYAKTFAVDGSLQGLETLIEK